MGPIVIGEKLLDRFIMDVSHRFPRKTFGYFLSSVRFGGPVDYVIFDENHRDDWIAEFHGYGRYYVDHQDAGFLASPVETLRVERWIRDHGYVKVGVFHSHQRHPAILTSVDVDFHPSTDLWHVLIVLRNRAYPLVRGFEVTEERQVEELEVRVVPADGGDGR